MLRSAAFDPTRTYRYALERAWPAGDGSACLFVMLNPSTADEYDDDPTVRRCEGFARDFDHSALIVANLYGLRATDPAELASAIDAVGPTTDEWLLYLSKRAKRVIVAWGSHRLVRGRSRIVYDYLRRDHPTVWCLGKNADGQPKHPLYLRLDSKLEAWVPPALDGPERTL